MISSVSGGNIDGVGGGGLVGGAWMFGEVTWLCSSASRGSTYLVEVGKQDVPLKVDLPPLFIVETKHPAIIEFDVCEFGEGDK